MLMRRTPRLWVEQRDFFVPRPQRPTWWNLPAEVRQKMVQLLAQLLRDHRNRPTAPANGKEVADE
jgi:hypothetical protein